MAQATKFYKRVLVGAYHAPVEVLELDRDIARLEQIKRLLDEIDSRNCSQDPETGVSALRLMRSMAWLCHAAAQRKMREYLKQ